MARELGQTQVDFLEDYLIKSKDTYEEFIEENESIQILEFSDVAWLEYLVHEDIFWIVSAYSRVPHKKTKIIFNKVLDLARKLGCKKIQFTTKRNPKAFERLFNTKTIQYKLEYNLEGEGV